MHSNEKPGEMTASIEEIALYNMLLSEALFEILADKGIVDRDEVTDRIKQLKAETKVNIRRPN